MITISKIGPGWVCAALVLLAAAAFARIVEHGFVSYDDPVYLLTFPQVTAGVSPSGIGWAFRATEMGSWHPLTWISHMVDWQLYGGWAGGHHLTSLALHAASAALLFLALERLTSARWPSAFVAAVFAVHPLNVEVVAWAAERKSVLSGLFWMLSLLGYARFVRTRTVASYAALVLSHALGLLAKSMGVTLPFVLLLLDGWPLGRTRSRGLVVEKLPLFALSAATSATAFAVGDVRTLGELPIAERIGNAIVGYAWYVAKTLWPSDLCALYLRPAHWPLAVVIGCLFALAGVTWAAVRLRRRRPYLLVGWLWFGGTLVPVIGLVQVGDQSFADRYAYLPMIGLSIMVAWGIPALAARWRIGHRALACSAAAAIGALVLVTQAQVRVWRDTGTLWTQAIAVATDNHVAHANLGSWLVTQGRVEEGLAHAHRAVALAPRDAHTNFNLGTLLMAAGDPKAAERLLRTAIEVQPAHYEARINLASALASLGRSDEAAAELESVLAAQPGHAVANKNLGYVEELRGDPALALHYYRRALAADPDEPSALRWAARILATAQDPALRDADEAIRLAERACHQRADSDPDDLDTLAAAYALAGRAGDAVATAERAARVATQSGRPDLAAAIARRAAAYAAGGTWSDSR